MAETASEKAKKESQGPTFMGRGRAVLTIRDFHSWKVFFKRDDQELSEELVETIEQVADASYDNYCVEGKIRIEWPEVFLDFNMDRFLGNEIESPSNLKSFYMQLPSRVSFYS